MISSQATPTGVEPFAIATAASYATRTGIYPLMVPQPSSTSISSSSSSSTSDFNIAEHWGNLSPQFSISSATYGLPNASPKLPDQCDITAFHTLFRHGARYPTGDAAPAVFAAKVANASRAEGSFVASGPLSFLNDWSYKLGAELLTPYVLFFSFPSTT